MRLLLATKTGLVLADPASNTWQPKEQTLAGHHVTSVIAREGVILAGTTGGIFRSDDGGVRWVEASAGLSVRHVRWLAFHPDISDCEFAGTEPAALFVSQDGGRSWQERPEVASLRDRLGWWLPYSPEAGCVRGFAFHGRRAYAAVEVGGALRSDDGGKTWELAAGSNGRPELGQPADGYIHPDVHSITVHPTSADLVFAPTGGGFFGSQDGGASWESLHSPCYVRAVWIDPADARRLILGPSEGPSGQNGRIETSEDGGKTWQKTAVSWPRNMVERFKPGRDFLFAVLANGQLLQTPLPAPQSDLTALPWTQVLPNIKHIQDVTIMVDG